MKRIRCRAVLGESAPAFDRNDAGLHPPTQAAVYKGTVKAEPKRRFPGELQLCFGTHSWARSNSVQGKAPQKKTGRPHPVPRPVCATANERSVAIKTTSLFHSCFPKIVLTLTVSHAAARRDEAVPERALGKVTAGPGAG